MTVQRAYLRDGEIIAAAQEERLHERSMMLAFRIMQFSIAWKRLEYLQTKSIMSYFMRSHL